MTQSKASGLGVAGKGVSPAATLSHELRQPLFAIKAIHQLALHGEGSLGKADIRLVVEHIRQVEELLMRYSSPSMGVAEQSGVAIDLRRPVEQAAVVLRYLVGNRGVSLELRLPEEPVWVRARSESMRQVVTNLLQNALDAVEGQGSPAVVIGVAAKGEQGVLWVQDNGPGIDPASQDAVFEAHVTSKGDSGGSGLGLFIARSLAEEAGGQLRAHSHNEGARLVMSLALAPAPSGS